MALVFRKSLILVIATFFISALFALDISPSLIYQIETTKNSFSYSFFIKNDIPVESIVNIEVIDFITDGRNYVFDDPTYNYSLKKYVKLRESTYKLALQEQREVIIDFDVPIDFPGASGVFALKISQESASTGKVQIKLNYIVPFFIRFKNIPVYQSIRIVDLVVKDLSKDPDDNYGDFGSLITLEIENNGNVAFIPKGSIQISSKDLKTTVAEIPLDSFDLVIFPERKTYYTFYVPYVLPTGKVDFILSGKSYDKDFYTNATLVNTEQPKESMYTFQQNIILFSEKSKSVTQSVVIFNLSPFKESISLSTENQDIVFSPKKLTVYPYKSVTFSIKTTQKDFSFSGDRIYAVRISNDEGNKKKTMNNLFIVLRGNSITPSLEAKMINTSSSTVLQVTNTGNCLVEFNILQNGKVLNESQFIIFPGQTMNFDFERFVQSTGFTVEYNAYKETKKFVIENF